MLLRKIKEKRRKNKLKSSVNDVEQGEVMKICFKI